MKKYISILIIAVMVLSMTACGSKDEIPTSEEINGQEVTLIDEDSQEEENEEVPEEETTPTEIGVDFDADVKAGLLWINNDGRVTDKDGNLIESYSYITAMDRKTLLSENDIVEGYSISDNMQIIIDESMLAYTEEDDSTDQEFTSGGTYFDTLLSIANPGYEGNKSGTERRDYEWIDYTHLIDNGGPYYSQIIYSNWWIDGVNGTPVSDEDPEVTVFIPKTLSSAVYDTDINALTQVSNFRLIDQNTCTIDQMKRSAPEQLLYGFYLQNVEKGVDSYGNVYFTGYLDLEYVCVYGDFHGLMNGDNVFVYAAYNGLNVNDVMIFDAAYIEHVN